MKIAIAELYTNNLGDWVRLATKNKCDYATKHGYEFFSEVIDFPKERHPSWYCIPHILNVFKQCKESDWVFWSDIDSLIMKTDIELSSFISEEYDFIVPNQGEGAILGKVHDECLNLGQFFIKKSSWSIELLNKVWLWSEGTNFKWDVYWENCVFNHFWKNNCHNFAERAKVVPCRLFGSFHDMGDWNLDSQYRFGDFLIPFAGKTMEQRDVLIPEYYKRIDDKTDESHVEPKWSEIAGITSEEMAKRRKV